MHGLTRTARAPAPRRRTHGRTVACAAAAFAWAHGEAHLPAGAGRTAPTFAWSFEPWILVLLAASMALYALGAARLWRRAGAGRGLGTAAVAAWTTGWGTLVGALVSPLDPLGESLFSAHMLQHELLMVVAAPLLVLGRPLAAWTWALPAAWRPRVGAATRRPGWRRFWGRLTHPLTAWGLHALALWGWHLPWLFEAALDHPVVHALQHASFLGTALLFWWTTLGGQRRPLRGAAIASLFTTMLHTGALGALMTLSPLLWYGHYAATSAPYGMDPLADQQLGGLIMWIPASVAYLAVGLALVARALSVRAPAASAPPC
ncbi:MAG: cytochrome c oxidase assembly protein [Vitreoscilla sp.]